MIMIMMMMFFTQILDLFYDTYHLLCYPHISGFSFHTFVVFLYQFVRNGT